jgi:hypothetical protein
MTALRAAARLTRAAPPDALESELGECGIEMPVARLDLVTASTWTRRTS